MAKTFEYEIVTLWPHKHLSDVAKKINVSVEKVPLMYQEILVLDQKGREGFEHYMTLSETEIIQLTLPDGKNGVGITKMRVKKLYFKREVNSIKY